MRESLGRAGVTIMRVDHRLPEGVDAIRASSGKRILPAQARKPSEIAVRGAQQQPMLDGQRSQMGIGDQVGLHAGVREQRAENVAVAFRGLWNPRNLAIKPRGDLAPRFRHGLGALEHPRVGDEAEKPEKAGPREADRRMAVQLRVEPGTCAFMLGKRSDVSIDQDVGVDQDHL